MQEEKTMWKVTFLYLCLICALAATQSVAESNEVDQTSNDIINPDEFSENDQYHFVARQETTELTGGRLTGEKTLTLGQSPYLLRTDLEIERDAKLIVEAGVTVQVAPMVSIVVRGVIKAIVSFFLMLSFFDFSYKRVFLLKKVYY